MSDTIYRNNVEFLEQNGWKYIGDRFSNGHCVLWCSELRDIPGGALISILDDIVDPLLNEINELKSKVEKQEKVLKFYALEDEVET